MDEREWLAARFEENRPHLQAVAFRMLGSQTDADDAVQDAWLRLSRADAAAIENFRGWLTTAVARVCLNMLQSRRSRRDESLDASVPESVPIHRDELGPEYQAVVADSVGLALLVVLETLNPAERVAFVLHDVFAVPFEEIAPVVGRSPTAARQLASRARRRVQGATVPDTDFRRQRQIVRAFLAAARGGDFDALLALLDPDAVVREDEAAMRIGGVREVRGAADVARTFTGRSHGARPALVDGAPGAVWAPGGKPKVVFGFTFSGGKIVGIDLIADPERLRELSLVFLAD